jgi:hypothetical protein
MQYVIMLGNFNRWCLAQLNFGVSQLQTNTGSSHAEKNM